MKNYFSNENFLLNLVPIPVKAVPTIPCSVPSVPAGAICDAYEIAAEYVNVIVMPWSSSIGNTQTGFLMIEYRKNLTAKVKNAMVNTCMWFMRFRMKPTGLVYVMKFLKHF